MLTFEQHLHHDWPPDRWRDETVIVAVSGGPDSVALLRALLTVKGGGGGQLIVAHYHHGLRGADADQDERFVLQLASQLELPCRVGRADPVGPGAEADSRQARYHFLHEVAQATAARYLATGHTADDQAETILHRVLRGTGIAGLAGIPRTRPLDSMTVVIRPLLQARRSQVLQYLEQIEQSFRTDATNLLGRYTRNRIRQELLPLLAEHYNPNVVEALLRLGTVARDVQAALNEHVQQLAAQAVVTDRVDRVCIDCAPLETAPVHLTRELFVHLWRQHGWPLQAMGFEHWQQLADLARDDCAASITLPTNIHAFRQGSQLEIRTSGP